MITSTSEVLYEFRTRNGWTQEEVAEAIGVDRVTYTRYENGTRTPNAVAVIKLSHLFKISPEMLLVMDDYEGNSLEEEQLLADYRALSDQGQSYIRQQMDIAVRIYKKSADLPRVESQQVKGAV